MKEKNNIEMVKKCLQHSQNAFADARDRTLTAYKYVMNNSWTDEAMAKANQHKKPYLKYNILIPILNTLLGNEQLARRRAYFKATDNNFEIADIIQGRWNALNDEQDIEETFQTAFVDSLISELGAFVERSFVMTKDGYLDFDYKVANNLRVHLDPETKAHDFALKKCGWLVKEGWENWDVLKLKYDIPGIKNHRKLSWWDQLKESIKQKTGGESTTTFDKDNDKYQILELQRRFVEKVFRVYDQNSEQYRDIQVEEWYKSHRNTPGLKRLGEIDSSRIYQTTLIPYFDQIVQDQPIPAPSGNFDVFPLFSFPFNIQVSESTSLVSLLKDPQDDVNKGKSQIRDFMSQIISSPLVVFGKEPEAVKELKQKGNQPGLVLNPKKATSKISRLNPEQMNPQFAESTESGYIYGKRISMVDEALTGGEGKSGESALLRQKKIQMAAGAINPYYKNLANLRKTIARDFVDNFGFVYAENERILNTKPTRDKPMAQVMVNINMAGKILFDVTNPSITVELDEGEDNITAKEDNFEKLMALNNMIAQVDPTLVDIISLVEAAPIKNKDKIIEFMTNRMNQISESNSANQQITETKQLLENMKINKDMMLDEEKLRMEATKNQKPEPRNEKPKQ